MGGTCLGPGSIPSTHGTSQGIYNSSFRGSTAASGPHIHQVHICALIYMEANTCEIKYNLLVLHRIYVAKIEVVKMAKNLKIQLDSYIHMKQISLKPETF